MATRFVPIQFLDKKAKYNIVGIAKCGTSSLMKYMIDTGFDVLNSEPQFYNIEYAKNFDYSLRIPIIITRSPIKRTESHIKYFKSTREEALQHSYYKAGLQMWDALIYSLEYLQTIPNFPHQNKGLRYD